MATEETVHINAMILETQYEVLRRVATIRCVSLSQVLRDVIQQTIDQEKATQGEQNDLQ